MRRLLKRCCVWTCVFALCLSFGFASAEFSPLFSLLQQEGVHAEVTGSFETLDPLTEISLNTVNDWLSRLRLSLDAGKNRESAEVFMDGESLFSVRLQRTEEGVLTAFSPSGGAYRTDAARKDALQLLSGGADVSFPPPTLLPELYAKLAEPLYALLSAYVTPRTIQDSTSVKNALSSAYYMNYVFQDGALNEIWPMVLDILLPALRETLADYPAWLAPAESYLTTLQFSGECRFKRLLDKNGGDMGMQFTGQIAAEGLDKRKITLFGGFTPGRGGYVSLSLPAVSGKNTLKFSFGGKLTEKDDASTLTFEGSFSRTLDGVSVSAEMEGTLTNALRGGEHWSGKVTLNTSQNGAKAAWTFSPALEEKDGGLAGTVTVQKKVGSAVKLKGTVALSLTAAGEETEFSAENAADLRGLDEEAARAAVMAEITPLSRMFLRLMTTLPEEVRTHLTHDLRTDAWMNGPLAPVTAPSSEDDINVPWIVVEEE